LRILVRIHCLKLITRYILSIWILCCRL
jgi:hypothetical protein